MSGIARKSLAAIVALLVVAGFLWWSSQANQQVITDVQLSPEKFRCPGCNVVFLNLELLRADHTGLISGTPYTPNIDRFFRNSIILHDVTSPGGETFLSNTAVQTGMHPHRLRISGIDIDSLAKGNKNHKGTKGKEKKIRDVLTRQESWSQILAGHGYHTIGINQGGRAGSGVYLDRGVHDYSQWPKNALLGDIVLQLYNKIRLAPDQPVYILFRPTTLHNMQYRLPKVPDWLGRLNITQRPFNYQPLNKQKKSNGFHLNRNRKVQDSAQRRMERQIYRAVLEYADQKMAIAFGAINKYLKRDTIVVLYSNHGTGLGDNDTYQHGTGYQASVHVPVFIRHPRISQPVHVKTPLALFDLVPTIASWIGVSGAEWRMLEHYDQTILRGYGLEDREIVGKNNWDEYIRLGKWKLITNHGVRYRLYDLDSDPGETRNLYQAEPGQAAKLETRLALFKSDIYSTYGRPE